mmetsp:Transcript_32790/g.78057  ORF Transcript_32790/g.78057 Transcript_32790/m.78057 type:complete len:263 (-) Transcript_32790:431-1219(-)
MKGVLFKVGSAPDLVSRETPTSPRRPRVTRAAPTPTALQASCGWTCWLGSLRRTAVVGHALTGWTSGRTAAMPPTDSCSVPAQARLCRSHTAWSMTSTRHVRPTARRQPASRCRPRVGSLVCPSGVGAAVRIGMPGAGSSSQRHLASLAQSPSTRSPRIPEPRTGRGAHTPAASATPTPSLAACTAHAPGRASASPAGSLARWPRIQLLTSPSAPTTSSARQTTDSCLWGPQCAGPLGPGTSAVCTSPPRAAIRPLEPQSCL